MKRISLLILLGSLAFPLPAQEPWTLERCIAYGLAHNTGIRRQEVEISVRKADLRQKQFAHLPQVGIQLTHGANWGRSVDMQELVIIRNKLTQATGASLNLALPLFDGLARHNTRLAARKSLEAAQLDASALARTLTVDITRAWMGWVSAVSPAGRAAAGVGAGVGWPVPAGSLSRIVKYLVIT